MLAWLHNLNDVLFVVVIVELLYSDFVVWIVVFLLLIFVERMQGVNDDVFDHLFLSLML
jgi:hypothetical protein